MLNVSSVSIALIDEGRIAFARAYGKDATPDTPYQAASLSKFVAAIGAMPLVEAGSLELGEDVNAKLTSWHVPSNEFDATHKVALRGLLSMTGGIGVPGFLGYEVGAPIPKLTEVLNGAPPANSPPVSVIAIPGSAYHYSGGGYEIVEALMQDATGKPFPRLMQDRRRVRRWHQERRADISATAPGFRDVGIFSPSMPRPDSGRRRPTWPNS